MDARSPVAILPNAKHTCYSLLLPPSSPMAPLMADRLTLSFLPSLEAILYRTSFSSPGSRGLNRSSICGSSGMALPFVLFPSAITNSLAVVLLPAVSEAAGAESTGQIDPPSPPGAPIQPAWEFSASGSSPASVRHWANLLPQRRCRTFHPDFILALPVLYLSTTMGKYFKRTWETRPSSSTIRFPYFSPCRSSFSPSAMGNFRLSGGASHRTGVAFSPHPALCGSDPPASQRGIVKPAFCLLVSVGC